MKKPNGMSRFLVILALLLLWTVACSTTQKSHPSSEPESNRSVVIPVRDGGQTAACSVKQLPAVSEALEAASATVPVAPLEEKKLAVRPYIRPEKPAMAIASSGSEMETKPGLDDDSDRPAPGVGIILPWDAVQVAPDDMPDVSELDPNIPLNLSRSEPEWIEEIEEAIKAQTSGSIERGADVGPDYDLSSPATPPSFLTPVLDSENMSRAIDPILTGWRSYPASPAFAGPPDVSITVGKDYIIAGYNSYYVVYNKSGAQVAAFNMSTLFTGLTNCASGNLCDPQVVYDDFNGGSCPTPTDPRYILSALWINAAQNDSRLCIAVSKTGATPTSTGNFWKFEVDPTGTGVADYPKIAPGPDALILGYNWFGTGYAAGMALDKTALYAGTNPTIREYTFAPASTYRTPWPATRVGCKQAQTPTYSGTHLTTYASATTALQLWRWPTPATSNNPTTYGGTLLTLANCSNPTGAYITTPYPLDCFPTAWQDAEQRGDNLYTTRSATGGAGSALQYARINVSGAAPSTTSSGTVSETGNYLWMPSVVSDRDYDFGLAFSRASQTNSIRASGAVAGNQAGTWGSVLVEKAGEVQYASGVTDAGNTYYRWGDYSGFAPDPEDGCTLWANAQYARNNGGGTNDASWIASYKFTPCSAVPQAFLDRAAYSCFMTVNGSIIDMGGTPTNAVYHSTTGGSYPAVISGGPNNYTVSPVTIAQLGAADGDSVWLSFTGSDAANHNSSNSVVGCAVNVCVSKVDDFTGGCDNDGYMDRGETMNVFVRFQNNETFALPTGFYADLRVDPAFPDAFVQIVTGTAEWTALDVGATGYAVGRPFQVKSLAGGTNLRTVNFEIYNIRAVDGSWTGGSGCSVGNLKFTKLANANNAIGASFTGFPESFDVAVPPTNWGQMDVVGTALNWARSTATVHPAGFATHSGAGLAYANSWTDNILDDEVRLQRAIDTVTTTNPLVAVTFWMFHDTQYSAALDSIQLQVCTAGANCTNNANWTSFGPAFTRPNLYGGANQTWTQHTVDASAAAGGKTGVRIGLLAHNEYGNDIHVDDVNFAAMTQVADASTCTPAPTLVLFSSNYGFGYFLAEPQCNNNFYADAGDAGTLLVYLSNTGNENANGVTATLTCPTCPAGVQICKSTANYGNIPPSSGYSYSQPDDGFRVAIPAGLAAASALPWVVTVSATNPYSTTINVPSEPPGQSRSGTYTFIENGDPYNYSIADYFLTAPASNGTNGRYGFSTAWTCSGGVSQQPSTTDPLGVGLVARLTGKSSTSPVTMAHTFSTASVTGTINNYIIFNYGRAATTSTFFLEYTNDGATWYPLIKTGLTGTGGAADAWVTYGYFSVYWQIYNQTGTGYGPAAANAMLGNPNWGWRFRCTYTATTNSYWEISPFWLDEYTWQNTATSCIGTCLGPEAPVVNEVRDIAPCALTGVQVYFDKGLGTTSTDLYRNGVSVVTNYTSGTTYPPGSSTNYNYTIHAINTNGTADSTPAVPGIDATQSITPTFACTPGTCTDPTSVLLTTQQGQSNYQWYRGGSPIGGANAYTYTATLSGTYTVSYNAGACTGNLSEGTVVTINPVSGTKPVPDGRLSGTPMNGTRITVNGSTISVAYDTATCTVTDHSILYGNLANVATVTPTGGACSIGNTSPYSWTTVPTAYDVWWVIVGDGGTQESSWGQKYTGGTYSQRSLVASNQCGNTTIDTASTCP